MTKHDLATPRSMRVLVVENHDDTRLTLMQLLTLLGHQAFGAASMQEALDAVPVADPEVLLSDIGLPDGDGWQLMERLEATHPIYAIAMSGFGMLSDKERSTAAGFRHHLVKPMDIDEVERVLNQASAELARG